LNFCIQNYLPGGPVKETLASIRGLGGEGGAGKNTTLSPQDIQKLTHELEVQYGLDKPVLTRYFIWLKNM
jgi:ABC-type dipeptide/oligopeptide/nickel transport system permease component